jgi:hypothetical protein
MIYLASPYSHPDIVVRERRFRDVCHAAVDLIKAGHEVFSPIAHSHALVEHGLPTHWSFWETHDRHHLAHCDEVVVLMLEGWYTSVGVQAELRLAKELNKPIRYLEFDRICHAPPTRQMSEVAS